MTSLTELKLRQLTLKDSNTARTALLGKGHIGIPFISFKDSVRQVIIQCGRLN
jgi:glutaredoxin-related protein